MNDLKKIKISQEARQNWPKFLQEAVDSPRLFNFAVEPERKLCEGCDYLYFADDVLYFHSQELGEMTFNFEELHRYHQKQHYAISKEPLARSLGLKGNLDKKLVWDVTCGSGKDSLLISFFGAKVIAFERHPIIFLLLKDALRRYPMDWDLYFGDAREVTGLDQKPDAIYYDPMYPEKKKKSALPRKEMRIFKEIVGEDLDADVFLDWALKNAKERVVVKRALEALPIKENPTANYSGKSTRYDMYKIF